MSSGFDLEKVGLSVGNSKNTIGSGNLCLIGMLFIYLKYFLPSWVCVWVCMLGYIRLRLSSLTAAPKMRTCVQMIICGQAPRRNWLEEREAVQRGRTRAMSGPVRGVRPHLSPSEAGSRAPSSQSLRQQTKGCQGPGASGSLSTEKQRALWRAARPGWARAAQHRGHRALVGLRPCQLRNVCTTGRMFAHSRFSPGLRAPRPSCHCPVLLGPSGCPEL